MYGLILQNMAEYIQNKHGDNMWKKVLYSQIIWSSNSNHLDTLDCWTIITTGFKTETSLFGSFVLYLWWPLKADDNSMLRWKSLLTSSKIHLVPMRSSLKPKQVKPSSLRGFESSDICHKKKKKYKIWWNVEYLYPIQKRQEKYIEIFKSDDECLYILISIFMFCDRKDGKVRNENTWHEGRRILWGGWMVLIVIGRWNHNYLGLFGYFPNPCYQSLATVW